MSDNSVNTDMEELAWKFVINVINAIKSNKCDYCMTDLPRKQNI